MRNVAVVAVLLLLPGCLDDKSSDPAPPGGSSPTATGTSSGPFVPPVDGNGTPIVPLSADWSGCRGLGLLFDAPAPLFPGSFPPGWDPSGKPINAISILIHECDRISWGPFERPGFMLQEWHSLFDAPSECSVGGNQQVNLMLESIWFSDPEIAAYARQVYGMNAYHADFTSSEQDPATGKQSTWTWAEPGKEASRLTFYDVPGEQYHTVNQVVRAFWSNGEGVSFWDFDDTFEKDDVESLLANGTLQPPMLYGRVMPDPTFHSVAASPKTLQSAEATIHRFRDTGCQEPY